MGMPAALIAASSKDSKINPPVRLANETTQNWVTAKGTGGRVLTYLKQLIDFHTTNVLLVGYQAEGTRGRQLLEGAHELKFFGKYYPVKANIQHLESLSAHADQQELLHWIRDIKNIPEGVFLIHGEPTALDTLRVKIHDEHGWQVFIPKLNEIREFVL